jgi:hypothetical protein
MTTQTTTPKRISKEKQDNPQAGGLQASAARQDKHELPLSARATFPMRQSDAGHQWLVLPARAPLCKSNNALSAPAFDAGQAVMRLSPDKPLFEAVLGVVFELCIQGPADARLRS